MQTLFHDRRDAGAALGHELRGKPLRDPLVLGLPRGGVPVADEVAAALDAPLDVLVVRKIGVPGHEELAMGAIAAGGVLVLMHSLIGQLGIDRTTIDGVVQHETAELLRREREYRGARPFPDVRGRTVIVVDDGVATGATMMAAIRALRAMEAGRIVAAAPVVSRQAAGDLAELADDVAFVALPEPFYGVGAFYRDFRQTTDEEVRALLADAAARIARPCAVEPLERTAPWERGGIELPKTYPSAP